MNDRRARLQRAESLLENDDPHSLSYAALELRQLIEVITYRKLTAYSKYVPESVMRTWQPPQAMKALLQFEPDADKDFSVRIAPEGTAPDADKGWFDLGHHKALGARWLTKNYNKLGSYLHAPHGDQVAPESSKVRDDLLAIVSELHAVIDAPIIGMSLDERVGLDCMDCGFPLLANVDALRASGTAVCFNKDCGAVHIAQEVDGEWQFHLDTIDAKCASCGGGFRFGSRYAEPGAVVECPHCGAKHQVTLGWTLLESNAGAS